MIKPNEIQHVLSDAEVAEADQLESEIDAGIRAGNGTCRRGRYEHHSHMSGRVVAEVCNRYRDAGWNVVLLKSRCHANGLDIPPLSRSYHMTVTVENGKRDSSNLARQESRLEHSSPFPMLESLAFGSLLGPRTTWLPVRRKGSLHGSVQEVLYRQPRTARYTLRAASRRAVDTCGMSAYLVRGGWGSLGPRR